MRDKVKLRRRPKHGWFAIPGIQTGERDIKERIRPLRPLLKWAKGATILDIGSAEGCISKWLIDAGRAKSAHLVEKHAPWLATARTLMPSPAYKMRFTEMDLEDWDANTSEFDSSYDIVLALNVIQKVRKPRELLMSLVGLTRKFFVYSGPDSVLVDSRSGSIPIDIRAELADFELYAFDKGDRHPTKGHLGVRMIFKRRGL